MQLVNVVVVGCQQQANHTMLWSEVNAALCLSPTSAEHRDLRLTDRLTGGQMDASKAQVYMRSQHLPVCQHPVEAPDLALLSRVVPQRDGADSFLSSSAFPPHHVCCVPDVASSLSNQTPSSFLPLCSQKLKCGKVLFFFFFLLFLNSEIKSCLKNNVFLSFS